MELESDRRSPKRILYLTRNGLLEPLGQSQILPYLTRLSSDYKITIISFEKPLDIQNQRLLRTTLASCRDNDLKWVRLNFRSQPRLFTPLLAFFQLLLTALFYSTGQRKPCLIHARSYIPAFIALIINRALNISFVFDMRALWLEELISGGHLRRESILHSILLRLESLSLSHASGVVSLTRAATSYLKAKHTNLSEQRFVVIPTCTDLQSFQFTPAPPTPPITVGCIGTLLSSWFMTDWLSAFFESFYRAAPNSRFEIITRDPAPLVYDALGLSHHLNRQIQISSAEPKAMPSLLQRHSLSVMFFTPGLSKLGSCPTRMAEVLGSGRPIVTNYGIGDLDHIILDNRIGVLACNRTSHDMDRTVSEILSLLTDPELSKRCRHTAETLFSLQAGIESYRRLYSAIVE